jgi:hypothetical protein
MGKPGRDWNYFAKVWWCVRCPPINHLNPIDKTSKFTPKAWASLIKLVKKQSIVLGDLLQELSDLYADNTILKAHKKATLSVWLPLLKTLASFNSICPLAPYFQVCMIVL